MKAKGNKAVFLTVLLHTLLILAFAGYVFCIKFPVVIWDDGLFLNRKFIASAKDFLISTLTVWFGAPVLIAVANTAFIGHVSRKYQEYVLHIRQMCTNAGAYFREHYPGEQKAIAQTTYFSGRIELLQKDAQTLRPEKLTAVFSNLRQCQNLEKEFRELVRRCEHLKTSHSEREFAQLLHDDFRKHLHHSAVLLNQYYPKQMQNSFSELKQYLDITASRQNTERIFKDKGFDSDTDFLLAELYAPVRMLAQDLGIIAEYLTDSCQEILKQNSVSGTEFPPLPEEMPVRLHEISAVLQKIPDGRALQDIPVSRDRKNRKLPAGYHENFRNYQAVVTAYDSCTGLYCQYIADIERMLLEQLLAHYETVQNAYQLMQEDAEEFTQAYEALKSEAESGAFTWHLYYLYLFSETQHRSCDVSLSSRDAQNLQCRLDAVKSSAETVNQIIRKDEETA